MPLVRTTATLPTRAEPPRTTDALLLALRTGQTDADRAAAASGLAAMPEAAEALGTALSTEPSARVREAIIVSLVGIGTDAAAGQLAGFLGGEDVALRNAAVEGLRQIGVGAAAQVKHCLASADRDERILAINVLETMPHADTRAWLRDVLARDPEVSVGLAAVEALTRVGEAGDTASLRDFAQRFAEEPFVGFAVDLACRRVATP